MEIKRKYCFVQFKYLYNSELSEDVRILGNIDALGKWQPEKAIKLIKIKKEENSWITKEKIKIPLFFNLEYKYLIFKNNTLKAWEEISNNENRKINLTKKGNFILLDKPKYFSTKIKEKKNISELIEDELITLNYDSDYDEKKSSKKISEENIKETPEINDNDNILIFSFYLPINLNKIFNKEKIEFNFDITEETLYHDLYRIIKDKKNIKWFGFLKEQYNITKEEKEHIKILLEEKNMFLLDIDINLFNKLIELINEYIEPDIYYISNYNNNTSIIKDFSRIIQLMKSYEEFNGIIAELIIKYLSNNSLIFFNDFHFLLVPNKLHELLKHNSDILNNLSLGIFLHNSFISYDIYKSNILREEILKSMLKCKVIGFYTFDSSKNFLTCAKKILNVNLLSTNNGDLAVNYSENNTLIRVKNITPEEDLIKEDINNEEFIMYYKELEKKFDKNKKKQIFVAIEQLNFLSCVKNKLQGYKKFLENVDTSKNLFLIYIHCTYEEYFFKNEENKKMIEIIQNLVNEIKLNFGQDVIELYIGKIPYKKKLALFAFSNCILFTNQIGSNSLDLYEFLLIKKIFIEKNKINIEDINIDLYIKNKDIINFSYIISELSGGNTSLGGAVKINHFDYVSIFKGFNLVNTLLSPELNLNKKKEKENYLYTIKQELIHSLKFSLKNWFYNFLKDIKSHKLTDENTFFICNEECAQFRLRKISKKFKKLEYKYISLNYEKSHNRLIFFDFEGTLPSNINNNKPTEEIINSLNELTNDKRNKIFIIAEKGKSQIYECFKQVKNLGVGVEYGFKYIINNPDKKNNKNNIWIKLIHNYNNTWIQNCISIMTPYTERYEGSFLDIKESSVVWYYNDVDQELGKNLASILTSELHNLINEYNLKIVNGKGFIEVIAFGINKGYFVSHILKKQIKKGKPPDFIMCVGDDFSDEKMFNYLDKKENEIKKYCKDVSIYSITVGKKPSKAKYYVNNVKNVKEIINIFVKITEKTSSSISSSIIRKSTLNLKYNIENEKNKEEK